MTLVPKQRMIDDAAFQNGTAEPAVTGSAAAGCAKRVRAPFDSAK
jgi:hypothetical protein